MEDESQDHIGAGTTPPRIGTATKSDREKSLLIGLDRSYASM